MSRHSFLGGSQSKCTREKGAHVFPCLTDQAWPDASSHVVRSPRTVSDPVRRRRPGLGGAARPRRRFGVEHRGVQSQRMLQSMLQRMQQRMQQGMLQRRLQGMQQRMLQGMQQRRLQGMQQRMLQGMPQRRLQGMPQGMPQVRMLQASQRASSSESGSLRFVLRAPMPRPSGPRGPPKTGPARPSPRAAAAAASGGGGGSSSKLLLRPGESRGGDRGVRGSGNRGEGRGVGWARPGPAKSARRSDGVHPERG
jgi:hypothetical protein